MKIDIKRHKGSLSNRLNFYENERLSYSSEMKGYFSWNYKLVLNSVSNKNKWVAKKKGIFSRKYLIYFNKQSVGLFKAKNIFKNYFELAINEQVFKIYGHGGLKVSVYKDDNQIAFFKKKKITILNEESIRLLLDKNEEIEPLLLIVLIWNDMFYKNLNENTLNINFGNINKGAIPLDKSWKPKG